MYSKSKLYNDDIEKVINNNLKWEKLNHKTILVIGASGMIGTFLIDVLMKKNELSDFSIQIIAMGRNIKRLNKRFSSYNKNECFTIIKGDITEEIDLEISCDYIFHGASNTHPVSYAEDPIGTIMTNILGTKNVLEYAKNKDIEKILFMSTVEIYGENRGDVDYFTEEYCGYIDCNTLRAGYSEGKRASEALCQSYIQKYGLNIVIPRICRTFGPTMISSDSKALSQFIKNAVNSENILLKSTGEQFFSFGYVGDIVSALLYILVHGSCGEAYNISNRQMDIRLKDLATILAKLVDVKVVFERPNEIEKIGFSKATKALLSSGKLNKLGWNPIFNLEESLDHTVQIMKYIQK